MIIDVVNWKALLVSHDSTIEETISSFESNVPGFRIVHNSGNFLGVITNGDLRRSFLRGISPKAKTIEITNSDAVTVESSTSVDTVLSLMTKFGIEYVPVVSPERQIIGLKKLSRSEDYQPVENHIVFMAGGRGTRLLPETENLPKPLVQIHGKPLLEHLILKAREQGFRKVVISLGHLGHKIEEYFGDGSDLGVEIKYLQEDRPLGSGGALSLISKTGFEISDNFVVANGDVLSNLNLRTFLEFQIRSNGIASLVGKREQAQIPYGVLNIINGKLENIEEKPSHSYVINAGMYAFNKRALSFLVENQPISMTEIFQSLLQKAEVINVFQIDDEWIDIGTPENLLLARLR